MKKALFLFVAVTVNLQLVWAQKGVLEFDESNRYVYYRVEEKPGIKADLLYQRALNFSKQFPKGQVSDQKMMHAIVIKDKFVVYSNALISRKEGGEVTYDLIIDTKDDKYRYRFSNFILKPYKINRYGATEVIPAMENPLEKISEMYTAKESKNYLKQIAAFCQTSSDRLKSYINKTEYIKQDTVRKVLTDNW